MPPHLPAVAPQRQDRAHAGEGPGDRGDGSILERGGDEPVPAEQGDRTVDDLPLVTGFLQIQVGDEFPGDKCHHVLDDGNGVSGASAQLGVGDPGERRSVAACPGVVVDDEDTVGRPPDVELDVLRTGGRRVLVRLTGGGAEALGAAAVGGDGGTGWHGAQLPDGGRGAGAFAYGGVEHRFLVGGSRHRRPPRPRAASGADGYTRRPAARNRQRRGEGCGGLASAPAPRTATRPAQASFADSVIVVPVSAWLTGQFFLASSAAATKPSSSRPGHGALDGEVDAGDARTRLEGDVGGGDEPGRRGAGAGQAVRERHGEAAGVGGRDQLLGAGLAVRLLGAGGQETGCWPMARRSRR